MASREAYQGQSLGSAFPFAPFTLREDYRGCAVALARQLVIGPDEVSAGSFFVICSEPFLCHKDALELAPSSSHLGINVECLRR